MLAIPARLETVAVPQGFTGELFYSDFFQAWPNGWWNKTAQQCNISIMKAKIRALLGCSPSLSEQICNSRGQLYRIALSWSADSMLADDLVQDTLNMALEKQSSLRDPEKLQAWLYRILYRNWIQHLRRRKPQEDWDDSYNNGQDSTAAQARQDEICIAVRQAVARLPESQRAVIALVDLQGMSYAEVAEVLEVPIGTVMSRLSRGRKALCNTLKHFRESGQTTEAPARFRRIK